MFACAVGAGVLGGDSIGSRSGEEGTGERCGRDAVNSELCPCAVGMAGVTGANLVFRASCGFARARAVIEALGSRLGSMNKCLMGLCSVVTEF
jgi:hypothetical protein